MLRSEMTKEQLEQWAACFRASNRIWDMVCAIHCPGDEFARAIAPTSTCAEIIASELGIEVPE